MGRISNDTIIHNIRLISEGLPLELNAGETGEFLDVLLSHNCQYLLWKAKLPTADKKAMLYKSMIARSKSVIHERYRLCEPLFHTLNEKNIPYAVYKGAVLSASAYGEPYYRKSFDIDLLVSKENADEAKQILNSIGFIQGRLKDGVIVPYTRKELVFHSSMTHQAAPFIMQTESDICPYINVDINFDIMWGESNISADMGSILNQTEFFKIGDITVKRLTPIMDFVAVCLHHYKDANSIYQLYNGKLKLCLFTDIFSYLKNKSGEISPDILRDMCNKLFISEYVYYCIYHAYLVFGDDILLPYLEALKTLDGDFLLDKFGLDERERKSWGWDFFERVLNSDFHEKFISLLDDSDMQKININSLMMLCQW